jgi:hypothetical protein
VIGRIDASRLRICILSALSLLLIVYATGFSGVSQVHAQTITGQTKIAVNPTAIAGLNYVIGSTITFEVNVTNAPAINSFIVSLKFNPKVLQAVGIDFTSSSSYVLGQSAAAFYECIDGVSLIGGTCTSIDDIGVVTLYATLIGENTVAPTNGPLFNVTFTVIHTGFSEIHYLTDQVVGCNSAGICGQPLTSLSFDGYFSDITCGGTLCTPPTSLVTYSPSVVFTGETILFDASKSSATNPGATIVSYGWFWGEGEGSNSTTASSITHVFSAQGDHVFTLVVTDNYGIIAFTSLPVTVFAPLEVFSISANPSALTILAGAMQTVQLSIDNLYGISEVIQLSASAPTGFNAVLNTTAINSSGAAQLNITATANTSPGTYLVNVTGATNELTRTATITVTIVTPDFTISPSESTTVVCAARVTCNTTITLTPQNGFSGVVTFAVSASGGLNCNTPAPVTGSGTTILGCSAVRPGDYSVTVTGNSGGLSRGTGAITYHVVKAPHGHPHHTHEHKLKHSVEDSPSVYSINESCDLLAAPQDKAVYDESYFPQSSQQGNREISAPPCSPSRPIR